MYVHPVQCCACGAKAGAASKCHFLFYFARYISKGKGVGAGDPHHVFVLPEPDPHQKVAAQLHLLYCVSQIAIQNYYYCIVQLYYCIILMITALLLCQLCYMLLCMSHVSLI
jgi:hypothetical protein